MGRDLEKAVLAGVLAGTAAALLLVALNDMAPRERPLTFGLVFWGYNVLAAVALAVLLLLVGSLAGSVLGSAAPRHAALPAGVLLLLGLMLAGNQEAVRAFAHLSGPARFRWLVPVAFCVSVAGLVAVSLLPSRRRLLRILGTAAVASCGLALAPPGSPAGSPSRLETPRPRGQALVVIGIDGADWLYLDRLIARGELPRLASLRDRGAFGPLKTLRPTLSPAIWTTIATGRLPAEHGVLDFSAPWLQGVGVPLPALQPTSGLGFEGLLSLLRSTKRIDDGPISSAMRRAPAFWSIATLHGSAVSVVNWWGTWPAEPILGSIVSEHVYYRPLSEMDLKLTTESSGALHPEALAAEIAPLIVRPADVTIKDARAFMELTDEEFALMSSGQAPEKTLLHEFPHFFSMFETDRRVCLHLARKGQPAPADLFVLLRLVDQTSHMAMAGSELVEDHLGATPEELRKLGRAVSEAYRSVDRAVGEILDAFGPATVVVVSDHGFRRESRWPKWHGDYNHTKAPDGVFIGAGPAFRPGPVDGLTVLDVLPLLAYVKGFAVEDELAGRLRADLITDDFREANPLRRAASYGDWERGGMASPGAPGAEQIERLRALGYIQ